jgi:hypothetical protein
MRRSSVTGLASRRTNRRAAQGDGQPQYIGQGRENISRPFALIVGIVYAALGVVGFAVTGFNGFTSSHGHTLLGLHINGFHNLVHLAIGLGFIVISQLKDATITQGVLIGGGLVYLAAALLGYINKLPILAVHGSLDADNFLHLFSGAAAVVFGLLGAAQQSAVDRVVAMPGRG